MLCLHPLRRYFAALIERRCDGRHWRRPGVLQSNYFRRVGRQGILTRNSPFARSARAALR
jgi:hypothetical protein